MSGYVGRILLGLSVTFFWVGALQATGNVP